MRTVSTFSFGAFALDMDEAVDPLVDDVAELDPLGDDEALSSVPVISTLCPTWGLSFESSASSR
jgi:hypothetical protein